MYSGNLSDNDQILKVVIYAVFTGAFRFVEPGETLGSLGNNCSLISNNPRVSDCFLFSVRFICSSRLSFQSNIDIFFYVVTSFIMS